MILLSREERSLYVQRARSAQERSGAFANNWAGIREYYNKHPSPTRNDGYYNSQEGWEHYCSYFES
jgi:hypothetical protein